MAEHVSVCNVDQAKGEDLSEEEDQEHLRACDWKELLLMWVEEGNKDYDTAIYTMLELLPKAKEICLKIDAVVESFLLSVHTERPSTKHGEVSDVYHTMSQGVSLETEINLWASNNFLSFLMLRFYKAALQGYGLSRKEKDIVRNNVEITHPHNPFCWGYKGVYHYNTDENPCIITCKIPDLDIQCEMKYLQISKVFQVTCSQISRGIEKVAEDIETTPKGQASHPQDKDEKKRKVEAIKEEQDKLIASLHKQEEPKRKKKTSSGDSLPNNPRERILLKGEKARKEEKASMHKT
jgi:hypothetical protein